VYFRLFFVYFSFFCRARRAVMRWGVITRQLLFAYVSEGGLAGRSDIGIAGYICGLGKHCMATAGVARQKEEVAVVTDMLTLDSSVKNSPLKASCWGFQGGVV
ncbi:MAG TPA: hypothetical protein VF818_07450, partial [Ktedonobacterales bacterium]